MNCARCNTPLVADSRFCAVCGTPMPSPPASSPASHLLSANSDATLIEPWSEMQQAQGQTRQAPVRVQQTSPVGWQPGQAGNLPQSQRGPWPQQPETFQTPQQQISPGQAGTLPQGVPWQQPPAQPWTLPQSGTNYPAAGKPGAVRQPKRRRRIWLRLLLILVILLAVLTGGWFLGLRPYLHGLAQSQLDQALADSQSQIAVLQLALPPGPQTVHASEDEINVYLALHETDQLKNLHMTITTTNLQLDFQAYGFNCTILAVPIVRGGSLQLTDVQVQGVLWLIMSNGELTTDLNNQLQDPNHLMHRSISKITLREHAMDIQVSSDTGLPAI
jgi:hypothetical protein